MYRWEYRKTRELMPVMSNTKKREYPSRRKDKFTPMLGTQSKEKLGCRPLEIPGTWARARPNREAVTPADSTPRLRRSRDGTKGGMAPTLMGRAKKRIIITVLAHDHRY